MSHDHDNPHPTPASASPGTAAETPIDALLRQAMARPAFALPFDERLDRFQRLRAALATPLPHQPLLAFVLEARCLEALLALATHPAPDRAQFEKKIEIFHAFPFDTLATQPPKPLIAAVIGALSLDARLLGLAIEISAKPPASPPPKTH